MRLTAALLLGLAACLGPAGCGAVYHSPEVNRIAGDGSKVRVVDITAESALLANRSPYAPKTLPAIFSQTAGTGTGLRGTGPVPEPAIDPPARPGALATRLPPNPVPGPYRIGVGDVLILATPNGDTVAELAGLLAAQNGREGYTVQDDGAIAIPNVGRVGVAGMTLEDAEAALFQRLVANNIDPTFSLEISQFNSRKVAIGGAVARPSVVPIALTQLTLDQAIAAAGGIQISDPGYATIRIYRDGKLYQLPLTDFYQKAGMQKIALLDGDSVFVDSEYEIDRAQAYFEQQIRIAEFRQNARGQALAELKAQVDLYRGQLAEARQNYLTRVDLDGVERDYVYLTGEVGRQSRYPLPYGRNATLADALYDGAQGVPVATGDVREIYVLRGSSDPREFAAVTAWRLDGRNAANFVLATRFQLRPGDVIFVAQQPVTKWGRVIQQITPSLITSSVAAASN